MTYYNSTYQCCSLLFVDFQMLVVLLVSYQLESCVLLKNDGNPVSLQERANIETTHSKNE